MFWCSNHQCTITASSGRHVIVSCPWSTGAKRVEIMSIRKLWVPFGLIIDMIITPHTHTHTGWDNIVQCYWHVREPCHWLGLEAPRSTAPRHSRQVGVHGACYTAVDLILHALYTTTMFCKHQAYANFASVYRKKLYWYLYDITIANCHNWLLLNLSRSQCSFVKQCHNHCATYCPFCFLPWQSDSRRDTLLQVRRLLCMESRVQLQSLPLCRCWCHHHCHHLWRYVWYSVNGTWTSRVMYKYEQCK